MKRKSIFALAIIGVLTIASGVSVFAATTQDFAGMTRGDSWQRVSGTAVKKTTERNPWVNWTYSEYGNIHKQWFTIVQNNKSDGVGEVRMDGYGTSDISDNQAGIGKSYYLKSKREHFIDPGTYVSGTWSPS